MIGRVRCESTWKVLGNLAEALRWPQLAGRQGEGMDLCGSVRFCPSVCCHIFMWFIGLHHVRGHVGQNYLGSFNIYSPCGVVFLIKYTEIIMKSCKRTSWIQLSWIFACIPNPQSRQDVLTTFWSKD